MADSESNPYAEVRTRKILANATEFDGRGVDCSWRHTSVSLETFVASSVGLNGTKRATLGTYSNRNVSPNQQTWKRDLFQSGTDGSPESGTWMIWYVLEISKSYTPIPKDAKAEADEIVDVETRAPDYTASL